MTLPAPLSGGGGGGAVQSMLSLPPPPGGGGIGWMTCVCCTSTTCVWPPLPSPRGGWRPVATSGAPVALATVIGCSAVSVLAPERAVTCSVYAPAGVSVSDATQSCDCA